MGRHQSKYEGKCQFEPNSLCTHPFVQEEAICPLELIPLRNQFWSERLQSVCKLSKVIYFKLVMNVDIIDGQHCRLTICGYFGWVCKLIQITIWLWDKQVNGDRESQWHKGSGSGGSLMLLISWQGSAPYPWLWHRQCHSLSIPNYNETSKLVNCVSVFWSRRSIKLWPIITLWVPTDI